ncbi:MAG: SAM-dependent methyltransferase [Verrucomicrobiota bacterium]
MCARTLDPANSQAISVETFMERALYEAGSGYYTSGLRSIGPRGDFSTSASLGLGLGSSISQWLLESKQKLEWKGLWHVIEIGGGGGHLALEVLKSMGWWERRKVHYQIVEISQTLKDQQQKLLKDYCVSWPGDMTQALKRANGRALLFSNELVDAFPCRLFEWSGDMWKEIFLYKLDESWKEVPRPLDLDSLNSSVLDAQLDYPRGQRVEVHESYGNWLKSWNHKLIQGKILTIDYGDEVEHLYYRKPYGSLRGYFHHQLVEGSHIYLRMGKQDLTADVNFTDLMDWGESLELNTEAFQTQLNFMNHYSPNVLSKDGSFEFANAFKVLIQSK